MEPWLDPRLWPWLRPDRWLELELRPELWLELVLLLAVVRSDADEERRDGPRLRLAPGGEPRAGRAAVAESGCRLSGTRHKVGPAR